MASQAIRAIARIVIAGVGVLGVTLITVSSTIAQTSLSNGGISFSDGTEQTTAVRTDDNGNTATGEDALKSNAAGYDNTSTGFLALQGNTDGFNNTASGSGALQANTIGFENTAIGTNALPFNVEGVKNTAAGMGALFSNDGGSENTAVGVGALQDNTTGSDNIALGERAGINLTTGDNNIVIGNEGIAGEEATIRIGDDDRTRTFIAGISGVTPDTGSGVSVIIDGNGQLGTIASSRRYKQDIAEMATASELLLGLRPVTFRYKQQTANGEQPIQYGLIAEEVAEQFPELVVFNDQGQPETVKYQWLSVLLLNELQKQHELARQQRAALDRQNKTVAELKVKFEELDQLVRQVANSGHPANELVAKNATD